MTDLGNGLFAVSVPKDAENFDYERDIIFYDLPNGVLERGINLGGSVLSNYNILGTVTNLKIDFDYRAVTGLGTFDFYELLSSKGLYFENPYPNPTKVKGFTSQENKKLKYDNLKWQQAENNLIEKLVIIKKV